MALLSGYLAADSYSRIAGACDDNPSPPPPPPPSPPPPPGQWGSWQFNLGTLCIFGKNFYQGAAFTSAIVAATYVASASWGYQVAYSCRRAKREHAAAVVEAHQQIREQHEDEQRAVAKRAARERAIELTKEAAAAARAGNCEPVVSADAQLAESDPEFRDTVFVRDLGIARCLQR